MQNNYAIMELVLKDEKALEHYAFHGDWKVRYAAAAAMGETKSEKWLEPLYQLLKMEQTRELYSQPKVKEFVNSYDDTRMAEQIVPIEAVFDREYPEELKEDWKCRGRVRQACLFAIYSIGKANEEILKEIYGYLEDPEEDYAVKAAGAMALGAVGNKESIPYLEKALEFDEWCLRTEAGKAVRRLLQNGQEA